MFLDRKKVLKSIYGIEFNLISKHNKCTFVSYTNSLYDDEDQT